MDCKYNAGSNNHRNTQNALKMTEEKGHIAILGAGESGVGTAVLAQQKGFKVLVSDIGIIKDNYKKILIEQGIEFEEEKHSISRLLSSEQVIKSPGIPDNSEAIVKIREKNIPVISEIEFATRYTNAKLICVTGSNGKTTTTNLIFHMMKKAGLNVEMAGNIGKSFALLVAEKDPDYFVLELSSFQLDGMFDFRADIAILLNITPDHLDRYDYEMQKYTDSKFRIMQNQTEDDLFIYCYDDLIISEELGKKNPKVTLLSFTLKLLRDNTAYVENEKLNINYKNNNLTMSIYDLALKGKHNIYNSMAAGIAGEVLRIRKDTIRESLSDFQGVEHRLEPVIKVHGIQFINDSKATNVNSTWYALESMPNDVILIMGGLDKGNDYGELEDLVKEKVKAIICLGVDNSKLLAAFGGIVDTIQEARSMNEAVSRAYRIGKKGDVALLSPACASFDLFDNYEDRGRQFKHAVRNL